MQTLHGSHFWMIYFPDWSLVFVMLFLCYGVLFLFRDFFEGHYYDVSFSSVIGDAGLIAVIMIAADILKKQGAVPAGWLGSPIYHWFIALVAVIVGIILLAIVRYQQGWFGEYADRYHNIVIVPTLSYLLATLLPVTYYQGSRFEKWATSFFLALWFILLYIDWKTDDKKTNRLDQQAYLKARGVRPQSSKPLWLFQRKKK